MARLLRWPPRSNGFNAGSESIERVLFVRQCAASTARCANLLSPVDSIARGRRRCRRPLCASTTSVSDTERWCARIFFAARRSDLVMAIVPTLCGVAQSGLSAAARARPLRRAVVPVGSRLHGALLLPLLRQISLLERAEQRALARLRARCTRAQKRDRARERQNQSKAEKKSTVLGALPLLSFDCGCEATLLVASVSANARASGTFGS